MALVLRAEPTNHLDGHILVRLFHQYRLEATFEGGVLFDVLAVLRLGRRADGLELASGEGGLHHVACVDGALCRPRSNDGVQFVDEQDDLTLRLAYLVHDALEPFLELAPELAPCHHAPDIQRQHAATLQLLGHVARRDGLGKALCYGRLAHTRPSDEDGIVLRPPDERLHHPPYLVVPSNDRVELPATGQIGQVQAEPLQRLVPALGLLIAHPAAAPHLLQCLVNALDIDLELLQQGSGRALVILRDCNQQVLGTDEIVVEALGLFRSGREHIAGPRRHEYLVGLVFQLGAHLQRLIKPLSHPVDAHAKLRQDLPRRSILLFEDRHQDVLDVPLAVAIATHHLLRLPKNLLCLLREIVRFQYHVDHLPCVFPNPDVLSTPRI